MAVYTVIYPPAHTADYVRATTQTAGNEAWRGTDPALPLTGTYAGNCWLSQQNISAPQKFCISYGQSFRPGRLVLNNYHYSGNYTTNGIKGFRVFGTNSAAAATNTDPANTTDLTLLAALTARQHIASNVADPQIFDFSASTDFQHIVLIIDSNFGGTYIAFRHIELHAVATEYITHYPSVHDVAHVKATSSTAQAQPWFATDPARSITGPSDYNAWSTPASPTVPQKYAIDHGTPFILRRIYLENQHYSGMYTGNRLDRFKIFGTNSAGAFANVANPGDLSELVLLGEFQAREHIGSNVSDPQYFLLPDNNTAYRYTVLQALNVVSGAVTIVFRRIEMQSEVAAGAVYGVDPEYTQYQQAVYGSTPEYNGSAVLYGVDPAYGQVRATVYGSSPWYSQALAAVYGVDPQYAALLPAVYGVDPEYGTIALAGYGVDPIYQSADPQIAVYGTSPEYALNDGIAAVYGVTPLYQSVQTEAYGQVYSGTGIPGATVEVTDPASGDYVGKAMVGSDGTYILHTYLSPDWRPTEVYIAGQRVYPKNISLRFLRNEVAHLGTLEFASPDITRLAQRDAPVLIKMWGRVVHLVVAESAATHLAHSEYSASVTCQSRAVRLEMPVAKPVNGELSGQMSSLAQQLAGGIPIRWQTIDDYIRPGQWIASGQSPLELLRQLATAVGATIHSTDSGELVVAKLYQKLVPDWPMATPDAVVSTMEEVELVDADSLWQPGYNRCEVGDQAVSASTMRIEEDSDRSTEWRKIVLVYQTPWRDDFDLSHADDPAFVKLEDLGVEERSIVDEEIQILRGQGNAQYPIYDFVAARYKARNLGTITTSEDGTIRTTEDGASLLYLSYRTKAHIWAVRDTRDGKVMLVAEREGTSA